MVFINIDKMGELAGLGERFKANAIPIILI